MELCRKSYFSLQMLTFATNKPLQQQTKIHRLVYVSSLIFFVTYINLQECVSLTIQNKENVPINRNEHIFKEIDRKEHWSDNQLHIGYNTYILNRTSDTFNNIYSKQNSSNTTSPESKHRSTRFKRGVVHLYNMVVCATGCNPLAYKGYGCYCGFLGSGYTTDGIDQCCKMHDWCYDATDCPMFLEYVVPYYWKCYHGYKPICAVEHGKYGGAGSCAQRLCECDRSFAECLKRYPCPTTKAMCTTSPWRLIQNLFMVV